MKRLYLSGPMSGMSELNFPAFHAAAVEYRANGYTVVNPAELNPIDSDNLNSRSMEERRRLWSACMRVDIAALVTCDEIVMLAGWEKSQGANLERHIALKLDMPIQYQNEHAGE
jgi:hypothetical protein